MTHEIKTGGERVIGRYTGSRGPLMIAVGGMHGNEPAGISALRILFDMLEKEPSVNPGFEFRGRLVGLIGNMEAFRQRKRYLTQDLNRLWLPEYIAELTRKSPSQWHNEDRQLLGLRQTILDEIESYGPEKVVFVDLHTTSAEDGIFSIPIETPESMALGKGLHAPIVDNFSNSLSGTFMQFFNDLDLSADRVAISFESGKHDDPLSVNRAVAALVNALRFVGMVRPEDVESHHDEILKAYTRHLPKVVRMAYRHPIRPGDGFEMRPGYRNFSSVRKGETLAHDHNGPIVAPLSGYVLMPLYQTQGAEGFFIAVPQNQEDVSTAS